ncbi:hypothetical protein K501DRAFT_171762, partial [Backusella circina FSU 941]
NYSSTCTLEDACSFGGFGHKYLNQTFSFFIPKFLHAGFIHVVLYLISHLQFGSGIERNIGMIRYMILYLGSALWGFILVLYFLALKIVNNTYSSMICWGFFFGLLGYSIIKLMFEWRNVANSFMQLIKIILSVTVSIVLGMIPEIYNFAHDDKPFILLFIFLNN